MWRRRESGWHSRRHHPHMAFLPMLRSAFMRDHSNVASSSTITLPAASYRARASALMPRAPPCGGCSEALVCLASPSSPAARSASCNSSSSGALSTLSLARGSLRSGGIAVAPTLALGAEVVEARERR